MNYIVFGATTEISYELINIILKKDKDPYFFLSSKNLENLELLVTKLKLSKKQYDLYSLDLTKNEIDLSSLFQILNNYLKKQNNIYFFPSIPCLSEGKNLNQKLENILNINFNSFIKILNYILDDLKQTNVITYTSTIACIKAKSKNYLYAASKYGVERYLFSLMHYFKYKRPNIQIFRLGFIRNHNKLSFKKKIMSASPKSISEFIFLKNKKKVSKLFYYPKKWFYLKYLIILMPRFLYKKFNN
jgi:short-subunit dehydrogenase